MAQTITKAWLPAKIKFSDTKETLIIKSMEDLPKDRPYKVLETRVIKHG